MNERKPERTDSGARVTEEVGNYCDHIEDNRSKNEII